MIKITDLFFYLSKRSSNNLFVIWAFFIFIYPTVLVAQIINLNENKISLLNKGDAFWHRSNQLGIVDGGGYVSISIFRHSSALFNYGIMGIGNFEKDNSYKMVVGYLEKDIRGLNIKLGRWRKDITSESELSTGSLIRGKNAIPIPQVSLRLSDFKKITFFNQDLWVKGGFSHGWFSKGGYVQAPFLHEKYVYFKKYFENQSSLTFGLVHEAMWGGETNKHGKQPQSFSDYLRVVFGRSGSGSAYEGEKINVLGNHLGIWDLSYDIQGESQNYRIYFQHPFEDKSGMYQHFFDELKKRKIPVKSFDGLLGFEIINQSNEWFTSFVYEYMNTMYQSGSESAAKSDSTYGQDDYFNHYIYLSGWTQNDYSLGNPLFIVGHYPGIRTENSYIINNRIRAHHFGLSGKVTPSISYKSLLTYSKNYGTYFDTDKFKSLNKPYPFEGGLKQLSGLIQLDFNQMWKNVNGQISYAFDRGDLYSDSDSFLFSISYQFSNLSTSH